jgi:hypothetical protein
VAKATANTTMVATDRSTLPTVSVRCRRRSWAMADGSPNRARSASGTAGVATARDTTLRIARCASQRTTIASTTTTAIRRATAATSLEISNARRAVSPMGGADGSSVGVSCR